MIESLRGVRRHLPALPTALRPCYLLSFLLLTTLLLPAAPGASAQALSPGGPVGFGSIALGSSAQSLTLIFSANVPTTIQSVTVTTDGATGKDFTLGSNSCIGTQNPPQSCEITVGFTPLQVGLRRGALLVTDSAGTVVNRLFLNGVGLGPQIAFQPVTVTPLASVAPLSPATFQPSALVYDGNGNLYFNDVANDRILERSSSGTFSVYATVNTDSRSSMAIAGDGTLYLSQPSLGTVTMIAPGGAPTTLPTPGITLGQPTGLAVDSIGYLYIADAKSNSIVRVAPGGVSAATLTLTGLAQPLSGPSGLAVDANNLYIADSGNDRIVALSLTSGAATIFNGNAPATAPISVAVDAAGNVIETTVQGLFLLTPSGVTTPIALPAATPITDPSGVTLTSVGDLTVADPLAGLFTLTRSSSALTFATPTNVGALDTTDGYQTLTVENSGNTILQLNGVDPSLSGIDFALGPTNTCPVSSSSSTPASVQIAVGLTCTYSVGFTPTAAAARTGTLTLSGGSAGPGGSTSGVVQLNGTGVSLVNALSLVVSPANTSLGVPVGYTLSALDNGVPVPGFLGTVQFTATDSTAVFLSGASYTFTAADAGTHTFPAAAGVQFNALGTFTLTAVNGKLTVTSNPVVVQNTAQVALTSSNNPTILLQSTTLTASVTGTKGLATPTGTITFMDGSSTLGHGTLINGQVAVSVNFTTSGAHSLTAVYSGDTSYGTATSAALTQNVEDYTIAVTTGSSSFITVNPGSTASFALTVNPVGGATFSYAIALAVTGLPPGAVATFTPSTLPAGSAATNLTLNITNITSAVHIQPVQAATLLPHDGHRLAPFVIALLLLPLALLRRRRKLASLFLWALVCVSMAGLSGCLTNAADGYADPGTTSGGTTTPQTYNLTVAATSGPISHTTNITLTVQ